MKYGYLPRSALPGFSLIELALVLIIIGILAGAVLKGQDVLEAARLRSVLNDIDRIRSATALYHDTFGQWPGNDSLALARFGEGVKNGSGNGLVTGEESAQFWIHLAKAGHMPAEVAPASKLGGQFRVEADTTLRKNILILASKDKEGILTPKQAASLKAKAEDGSPSTGQIIVSEGTGGSPGSCVKDGTLNLSTKSAVCILRVELP